MLLALLAATYLNGVNIDGVRSQTFEKCRSVRIDERGDVHLEWPGYEVQAPKPAAAAPATPVAAALTKHYWLVSEENPGAAVDLDVFVHSKWVRKVKSGDPQMVLEVTKYLQPGSNKVLLAAAHRGKPLSAAGFLKLTLGEGEAGGNTVMIDNPLLECKRTGVETDNVNEEFTIQAR